jgi:hypothetical protein
LRQHNAKDAHPIHDAAALNPASTADSSPIEGSGEFNWIELIFPTSFGVLSDIKATIQPVNINLDGLKADRNNCEVLFRRHIAIIFPTVEGLTTISGCSLIDGCIAVLG